MKISEAAMHWKYMAESPSADDLIAAYLGWQSPAAADRVSSEEELLHFALWAGGLKLG
jgi:hypothetical protein